MLLSFHSSPMPPINETTHGVRSSSRVAIKKSIADGQSPPHSPSKTNQPSHINIDSKSSRHTEILTPPVAASHPMTNVPCSFPNQPGQFLPHSTPESNPPSHINVHSKSSSHAEILTLPAAASCPAANGPWSLPKNNPPSHFNVDSKSSRQAEISILPAAASTQ